MSAKELVVKPIERAGACAFVKRYHYSGKVVPNSQLHLGVFWRDKLEGVMQFGPSMRKDLMQPLVTGTAWNGFLELNRMVFSDVLPRNSESRALSVALRLLRAHYRHIDWVVTFSDGCQCGDGTIYRASGFVLTGLKRNTEIKINPETGMPMATMAAYHLGHAKDIASWMALDGYMMRYMYFLKKDARARLTVPVLPFKKIDEMGASMYLGEKIKRTKEQSDAPPASLGGATPTRPLQHLEAA